MAVSLALNPVARPAPTLRERAYGSFTQHLMARDLRAGQFISQRELVELTGLPLGAIRELVPRLETEGLIRTVPKRGMQIAHVDINLIRDAFQFRLYLEREAVAQFAAQAPDETIDRLRREHQAIIAECEAAEAAGGIAEDLVTRAQLTDWGMHMTIIDFTGNAIIVDAYRVNAIKIRLIKQEQTRLSGSLVLPTMREHIAVIEAIASRDAGRAAAELGSHIMNARDRAMNLR